MASIKWMRSFQGNTSFPKNQTRNYIKNSGKVSAFTRISKLPGNLTLSILRQNQPLQIRNNQLHSSLPLLNRREDMKEAGKKGAVKAGELIKKYGITAVVVYFGLYFSVLGGLTGLVAVGLIPKGNIEAAVEFLGLEESFNAGKERVRSWSNSGKVSDSDDKTSNIVDLLNSFATAWILTKFTEPIRLFLTAAIVPSVYRWIKRV